MQIETSTIKIIRIIFCKQFLTNTRKILKFSCLFADKHYVVKRGNEMIKKLKVSENNISSCVEFLLQGAKKRRAMAISNAKTMSSDMGIKAKLVALN